MGTGVGEDERRGEKRKRVDRSSSPVQVLNECKNERAMESGEDRR